MRCLAPLMRKDNVEIVVPKALEFVTTDQALTVAPEPYRPPSFIAVFYCHCA